MALNHNLNFERRQDNISSSLLPLQMSEWIWEQIRKDSPTVPAVVRIPPEFHISPSTFTNLLGLIYGRKVSLSLEDLITAAEAASHLKMDSILKTCLEKVGDAMTPLSSLDVWVLAVKQGFHSLADQALRVLREYAFSDCPQWREMMSKYPVELLIELLGDPDLETPDTTLMARLVQWYCQDMRGRRQDMRVLLPFLCHWKLDPLHLNRWWLEDFSCVDLRRKCVCARAHARARVCVCVRARARAYVCMLSHVCILLFRMCVCVCVCV